MSLIYRGHFRDLIHQKFCHFMCFMFQAALLIRENLCCYFIFYSNLLGILEECRFKCTFKNIYLPFTHLLMLKRSAKTFLFGNVNITLVEMYLTDLQTMASPIDR